MRRGPGDKKKVVKKNGSSKDGGSKAKTKTWKTTNSKGKTVYHVKETFPPVGKKETFTYKKRSQSPGTKSPGKKSPGTKSPGTKSPVKRTTSVRSRTTSRPARTRPTGTKPTRTKPAGTSPTKTKPTRAKKEIKLTTVPRLRPPNEYSFTLPRPKRVPVPKSPSSPSKPSKPSKGKPGGPSITTVKFKPPKMKVKASRQKKRKVKCHVKNGRMSCK